LAGPGGPTVGRVNIRVAPDTSRFRRELGQALETLERSLAVSIPTRIDTRRLARDAARVKADVERQIGELDVAVNVNSRAAGAQLATLARDRTANIRVDVDQGALSRIQGLMAGIGQGAGRLVGGAAGIGAVAGSLSTLAAGAAAAVVPVLQLSAALAPAVGILTTLPAAAGTAAAALAPLVIAFSGMGEALGAALAGDAEALAEAMADLAPAAQSVVLAVSELAPGLSRIRDMVQEGFFQPLVEPVSTIGSTLLPTLGRGLTLVSLALGESAATLMSFIQEGRNLEGLDLLFQSTGRSVENLNGFMPGLLVGFRELGIVGLPFMEQLSLAASEAATEFGRWATHAAESGEATEWIEGALVVFSQLGEIAGNMGTTLGGIFTAAESSGESMLSVIEGITAGFSEWATSAEGQEALVDLFTGLRDVGEALGPVIAAIIQGVGTLAPAVGRIAEAFGPVLTTAIEGLVPALLQLEPGITAIVEALGEGIGALVDSGALELLGQALSDILIAVAPLLPVIGQLAALLIGALAQALIGLAPSLALIATALAEELAPLLPDLIEAFNSLVAAVLPLIPPLIEALLPGLELLPPIVELLVENFDAWAEVVRLLTPLLLWLMEKAQVLVGVVVSLAGALISFLAGVIRWARESSARLREAFTDMVDRARDTARKVVEWFLNLYTRGRDIFTRLRTTLSNIVQAIRSAVVNGISNMVTSARERISNLLTAARRIPGQIRTALGSLGGLLRQAGRNVITGLINGITSKMSDLWGRMGDITQGIRDFFPYSPARRGPLRVNPPDVAGENISRMLAEGIGRGATLVSAAADQVAGAAVMPQQNTTSASTGMYQSAAEQTALLARMLDAIRESRGDLVLQVDSTEIARAAQRGDRQLARR